MYEKFEELMKTKGVKAAEVARETGMSPVVFSEWKKGKSIPKVDKLLKIAKYFGVSVEYPMTSKEPSLPQATESHPPENKPELHYEMLTPDEEALLSGYRTASPEVRAIMSGVANGRYGLEAEDAPSTSSLEGAPTAHTGTERAIA